jgi:hypothetical protein
VLKKIGIVLGVLLVLALIAALGAYIHFDSKYGISKGPRTTYAEAVGMEWPTRLILQPPLGGEPVQKWIGESIPDVPPWLVDRVMPYESTLVMKIDNSTGLLNLELFLNEQMFGPVMAEQLNNNLQNMNVEGITWAPEGVLHPQRGVVTVSGSTPLDRDLLDVTQAEWGDAMPRAPLSMEGDHFIEILLDNRDGATHVLSTLLTDTGASDDQMMDLTIALFGNAIRQTESIRIFADPSDNDGLDVRFRILCSESSGRSGVESVKTVLDTAMSQLEPLATIPGLNFSGSSTFSGRTVEAEYQLSPFSAIINLLALATQ